MPQSLAWNLIHLVYSTKGREPWLVDEIRPELFAYQASIFKDLDSTALLIGGMPDHVHALFALSKNHSLAKVVEEVKKASSKWMKKDGRQPGFAWQGGYAAFSVSESNAASVRRYIDQQAKHHEVLSFQDELRILFKKHGVDFDERYVWG